MFQNFDHSFERIIIERQGVVVYKTPSHKIYLLGTNHTSEQSVKAIQKLINLVQPRVVAVELCRQRLENANVFEDREKYEKKYRDLIHVPHKMRQKAVGEITRLILAYQAMRQKNTSTEKNFAPARSQYKLKPIRIDENLTIAGDVFAPFGNFVWSLHTNGLHYLSSRRAPYKIILADRPIGVTYAKLANVLDRDEKTVIRTYKRDFLGMFFKNQNGIMKIIWNRNKSIRKIVLQERDEYLAESILRAAQLPKMWGIEFSPIVAVVGRAHIDGILARWISKSKMRQIRV